MNVTCHCTKCNMFSEHVYLHDSGLEMNCSHSLLYTSSFSVSSRTADGFDLPCNNDIELHVYLGTGIILDMLMLASVIWDLWILPSGFSRISKIQSLVVGDCKNYKRSHECIYFHDTDEIINPFHSRNYLRSDLPTEVFCSLFPTEHKSHFDKHSVASS